MTDAVSGRRNVRARPVISRRQVEHSVGVLRPNIDGPKTLSVDVTESSSGLDIPCLFVARAHVATLNLIDSDEKLFEPPTAYII